MKKNVQHNQVIDIMKSNGGYATLGFLNQYVDVSHWKTKTPFASIRRIVQDNRFFFKIKPGLWALKEFEKEILRKFKIDIKNTISEKIVFTHSYYQGLLLEIGNLQKFITYVPPQDKNKLYLEKKLLDIASITKIYDFSYPEITRRAKTIDVIWFNNRNMPHSFFEVEHSTDIQNSLLKFYDLQDFFSKFYIVSDQIRKREYEKKITYSAFEIIRKRVSFISYEYLSNLHSKTLQLSLIKEKI